MRLRDYVTGKIIFKLAKVLVLLSLPFEVGAQSLIGIYAGISNPGLRNERSSPVLYSGMGFAWKLTFQYSSNDVTHRFRITRTTPELRSKTNHNLNLVSFGAAYRILVHRNFALIADKVGMGLSYFVLKTQLNLNHSVQNSLQHDFLAISLIAEKNFNYKNHTSATLMFEIPLVAYVVEPGYASNLPERYLKPSDATFLDYWKCGHLRDLRHLQSILLNVEGRRLITPSWNLVASVAFNVMRYQTSSELRFAETRFLLGIEKSW